MKKNWKWYLGIFLASSPLIGLFSLIVYDSGFKAFLIVISFLFIIIAPIVIGTKLMVENDENK
jgi:hypothetical protein